MNAVLGLIIPHHCDCADLRLLQWLSRRGELCRDRCYTARTQIRNCSLDCVPSKLSEARIGIEKDIPDVPTRLVGGIHFCA